MGSRANFGQTQGQVMLPELPKKNNLWSSFYAIKFVECARKRANEKTILFASAGSYHCKWFKTSTIPLFDPTFEDSQPLSARHFGGFKQIVQGGNNRLHSPSGTDITSINERWKNEA